jgi:septal ring factor EnvC (AmiA/AmiB activator)
MIEKIKNKTVISLITICSFFCSHLVVAQSSKALETIFAIEALDLATTNLKNAKNTKKRIKSLSQAIQSYEETLAILRISVRDLTLQQSQVQNVLDHNENEIMELLGVLATVQKAPITGQMLHPNGPLATARSGMIVSDIVPILQENVDQLRDQLLVLKQLSETQFKAQASLQTGLLELQKAHSNLGRAIANRKDLPKRFTTDPEKLEILIKASKDLETFAASVQSIALNEPSVSLPSVRERKGNLNLPVRGKVLRKFNEADASGTKRSGIILATDPSAIVISPTAATIRYLGPLLDFGNVAILEPQDGLLFVFAGMDTVYGEIGQVIPALSPIGLMPSQSSAGNEIFKTQANIYSGKLSETLYVEVRSGAETENPLDWFK